MNSTRPDGLLNGENKPNQGTKALAETPKQQEVRVARHREQDSKEN